MVKTTGSPGASSLALGRGRVQRDSDMGQPRGRTTPRSQARQSTHAQPCVLRVSTVTDGSPAGPAILAPSRGPRPFFGAATPHRTATPRTTGGLPSLACAGRELRDEVLRHVPGADHATSHNVYYVNL